MADGFKITWDGKGLKAQCAPDPAYPYGKALDVTAGRRPACTAKLPYPAKEIGAWHVECERCGLTTFVTAAGRPDDPTQVKLPCKGIGASL